MNSARTTKLCWCHAIFSLRLETFEREQNAKGIKSEKDMAGRDEVLPYSG